jgi:acetamidase/formamidase
MDASAGQITQKSTVADVPKLDFARVNPVAGPVYVDGAEPGDAIKVTLLSFAPSGWGWTANIPGFGLLTDQFKEPGLHIWKYDAQAMTPAMYGPGGRVPLKPFCGTIGLAPAEPGQHSIVPPRRVGGNMDIRDMSAGTGAPPAGRGEGAGCSRSVIPTPRRATARCAGTAIESPFSLAAKFDLVKGANLKFPRFTTAGPVSRHFDVKGYEVTTGIDPDLMVGARAAVSGMVDLLSKRYNMKPLEAYMLCSVCADLRISEIVDMPNWVVSLYFPRVVFE